MKISVKVIPNSKEQKIKKEPDGSFKIYIKSPAKEGKANQELIKTLSDYFRARREKIKILFGIKSKTKIIQIEK